MGWSGTAAPTHSLHITLHLRILEMRSFSSPHEFIRIPSYASDSHEIQRAGRHQ